jgi:hypothetical protein
MRPMNADPDPRHNRTTDAKLSEEAVVAYLRAHGRRAPHEAVDWDGLAERVMESARFHLGRRAPAVRSAVSAAPAHVWGRAESGPQGSAGRGDGAPAAHQWWEVTAAWARPAVAAALVVSAISGMLALAAPATSVADSADYSTATTAWLQSVSGMGGSSAADRPDRAMASPDSLYTAVVEQ